MSQTETWDLITLATFTVCGYLVGARHGYAWGRRVARGQDQDA